MQQKGGQIHECITRSQCHKTLNDPGITQYIMIQVHANIFNCMQYTVLHLDQLKPSSKNPNKKHFSKMNNSCMCESQPTHIPINIFQNEVFSLQIQFNQILLLSQKYLPIYSARIFLFETKLFERVWKVMIHTNMLILGLPCTCVLTLKLQSFRLTTHRYCIPI